MTGEVEIEIYFPIGSHFGGELVTEDKGGIGVMFVIPVEEMNSLSVMLCWLNLLTDNSNSYFLGPLPVREMRGFHGVSSMAKPLTPGNTHSMGLRMNKPVFTTKLFLLAAM